MTRALLAMATDVRDDRAMAEQICLACAEGFDIDGAGISLMTASTLRETLATSDATADLLEELQFGLGEGPCMEAAETGRPVLVPDLKDVMEPCRWPVYVSAAGQAGVEAVFALPLQWGTTNLGVLDLYRRTPGPLGLDQLRDAVSVADTAALMLLGLRTHPTTDTTGIPWDPTWGHRAEIHQATGMIIAQLDSNPTDAFARLRARAYADQRLLSDIAHDVVARRLRFTKETHDE